FQQKLIIQIQKIKCNKNNWCPFAHFAGYALASQPLLERSERQCAVIGWIPGDDFPIQNRRLGDLLECFDQLKKALAYIFTIARKKRDASGLARIATMQLRAEAVIFVLNW